MKCYRNCGLDAVYQTKKGNWVCNKNAGKCPSCSSKGKKRDPYSKPDLYNGEELCAFGCNQPAKFKLKNGKLCCRTTAGNCPFFRVGAMKKRKITFSKEVEPGVTLGQRISRKAAITKSKDIVNGLTKHQRNSIKVAEIKRNKIDPETRLNVHQKNGLKFKAWSKTLEGKASIERQAKQLSEQQNKIDPITGIKEAQRRCKIMIETKLKNIDENGLNSFERTHWKGGKGGFVDNIYYHSSNEKRFLEMMKATNQIQNIKRGRKINYIFNGKEKIYLPDYIINDNILFEIKSKYTMFGKDNEFLKRNVAKLQAAQEDGYIVFLVIDDKIQSFESFCGSFFDLIESVFNE